VSDIDENEFADGEKEPVAVAAPVPNADETDALLSRLRLIEDQPLETRAEAFGQINDELQARLESGDIPRQHG